MRTGAYARRTVSEAARLGFGCRYEFGNGLCCECRPHDQHLRADAGEAHRGEVFLRVVGQLLKKERIDAQAIGASKYGVSVGPGLGNDILGDATASTGPVVHNDLLAEQDGQLGCDQARDNVWSPTGRVADEHSDGPVRILVLRRSRRKGNYSGKSSASCGKTFRYLRAVHG